MGCQASMPLWFLAQGSGTVLLPRFPRRCTPGPVLPAAQPELCPSDWLREEQPLGWREAEHEAEAPGLLVCMRAGGHVTGALCTGSTHVGAGS